MLLDFKAFFSALSGPFFSTDQAEVEGLVFETADFHSHDSFWVLTILYSEFFLSLSYNWARTRGKGP